MIKEVKLFSYNQVFVPWGLSALALRLYTCIKLCNFYMSSSLKQLQISCGAFCQRGIDSLSNWFCAIEQDGHRAYTHMW